MQTQLYEFSCPERAQFGEKSSALGKTLKTVNMWLRKMVFGKQFPHYEGMRGNEGILEEMWRQVVMAVFTGRV